METSHIDGCCSKWEDYQQTQSATKAHLSVQTKRPSDGRAGPAGCQHPRPPVFAGEVCQSWRSPDGDKRNMQQVYQFSRPSSYQQSAIEKPILQERSNAKCNSAPHPMFLDVGQRSFTSPLHLHAYAQNTTVEVLWVSPTGRRAQIPFRSQPKVPMVGQTRRLLPGSREHTGNQLKHCLWYMVNM